MAVVVTLQAVIDQLLQAGGIAGLIGNLLASGAWDAIKALGKPLLDKLPNIIELSALGGTDKNHDLLRTLRRAECRALVALCDQTLRLMARVS